MNFSSTFYLNAACLHHSNEFILTCSATETAYSAVRVDVSGGFIMFHRQLNALIFTTIDHYLENTPHCVS
jgi:hypothetical protein